MKKRPTRCYTGFAEAGGVHNIEVCYTIPDHGYEHVLLTCIACGEIFTFDRSNPRWSTMTLEHIAEGILCPTCGSKLCETAKPYPDWFLAPSGQRGRFVPPRIIPPDDQSFLMDFYTLE